MGVILFVVAFALLALPGAVRRPGRRLSPAEWSRFCVGALLAGATLLEITALLYAAPTVLRALGIPALAHVCERALGALAPAGAVLGWPAAAVAIVFPVVIGAGVRRARREQEAVHVDAWLGDHREFDGHALVVLPTPTLLAFCSNGPTPQIVVSDGLLQALGPDELAAVLRHEAAHLQYGHQRMLIMASALSRSLGLFPFVRRSTSVLRIALERWADETAAGGSPASRRQLRQALLALARLKVNVAIPAFSAEDTVAERVEALRTEPSRPSLLRRVVAYAPAAALCVMVVVAAAAFAGDVAHHLVAWSHHCR